MKKIILRSLLFLVITTILSGCNNADSNMEVVLGGGKAKGVINCKAPQDSYERKFCDEAEQQEYEKAVWNEVVNSRP